MVGVVGSGSAEGRLVNHGRVQAHGARVDKEMRSSKPLLD